MEQNEKVKQILEILQDEGALTSRTKKIRPEVVQFLLLLGECIAIAVFSFMGAVGFLEGNAWKAGFFALCVIFTFAVSYAFDTKKEKE